MKETIEERFARFHEANPRVYERLAQLARLWEQRSPGRHSIAMLYEVLRWEWGTGELATTGDSS